MKFFPILIFTITVVISVQAWRQKYGNDFVTYSIGDRFERGEEICSLRVDKKA